MLRYALLASLAFIATTCPILQPHALGQEAITPELLTRGEQIYTQLCASCHGTTGEGVADKYADPLTGDATVSELTSIIDETMPEGEPGKCVGPDAHAVAAYIHEKFYSEAAQVRNRPPRNALARLTANQLRQSIADLYGMGQWPPQPTTDRGVKGVYFDGARWKNENKKIDRVDPRIDFDFGHDAPGPDIQPKSFYIYWEGSVLPDQTGRYEIVVRSTCSFVMDFGKMGRKFIDNHVQSGDKTEFREAITLTAGRAYPFKIDFIQRERKTELPPAKVSLSWVTPQGIEEVIPQRNLIPQGMPATYSLQATLPPDDRSYGFERGLAVNRQWDDSTTDTALEFGDIAVEELWPQYRRRFKDKPDENRQQLRDFLKQILETAFRGPLTEDAQRIYLDRQLEATPNDAEAIRRVCLLGLKSPRFLYPLADKQQSRSQRVANRLALTLYDSLPADEWLVKAVRQERLVKPDQAREAAKRMLNDYRVRAKAHEFVLDWLNLSQQGELSKDEEKFSGFDQPLVRDLRMSLDSFIDEVIWNGSGDYRQFFEADWSYTTDRLAKFYGDAWKPADAEGPAMRRSVADGNQRFGLITHPYLMSALAHFDTSSPIHRGVFLIRYTLGRTLRPPAEAIAPISPDLHPNLTTRQRVAEQTKAEGCQVCHGKINSLGFALENFDAVGRFRDMEREQPVDAAGSYTARSGENVNFNGARELARYLAGSPDAHRAFVNRAFQYFVKQPIAAYGPTKLDELTAKFAASGYNVRDLLVEIAVIAATEDPALNEQDS